MSKREQILETGYKELDQILGGLHPSDFIMICSRPGVGKSALALNIVDNIAIKNNIPVAFFCLEESAEQFGTRLISQNSMVSLHKMRKDELNEMEKYKLVEAGKIIGKSPIFFDDRPSGVMSLKELKDKCRKFKEKNNIQLVIIDYLQLLGWENEEITRAERLSMVSETLKSIAKELGIVVLATAQICRALEFRKDKKPILQDLHYEGSIEQDADVIIFLSKLYDYEKKMYQNARFIVNVAKNKNGRIGDLILKWNSDYTKFESIVE